MKLKNNYRDIKSIEIIYKNISTMYNSLLYNFEDFLNYESFLDNKGTISMKGKSYRGYLIKLYAIYCESEDFSDYISLDSLLIVDIFNKMTMDNDFIKYNKQFNYFPLATIKAFNRFLLLNDLGTR